MKTPRKTWSVTSRGRIHLILLALAAPDSDTLSSGYSVQVSGYRDSDGWSSTSSETTGLEFSEAQASFDQMASSLGWSPRRDKSMTAIQNGEAILRLRAIGTSVILEVTHGPLAGPSAGWLGLYSDENPSTDVSFLDSVEYGLSLMGKPPDMRLNVEVWPESGDR